MANCKPCTDFEGRKFSTTKEMCEYYEIDPRIFRLRIKNGWSLKMALTTPTNNNYYKKYKYSR